MTEVTGEKIKDIVKEHYASLAQGAASCCSPSSDEVQIKPIYSKEELERLPVEAVAASAGCGNPTALASLKPGEVVLDLGSGGGIDCFPAAYAVGLQGRVIGVDMTPDMVKLARRNAETLGLPQVEFLLSEMERMPIEDNSVDVIISNCVICLAPDKDAVFSEAYRVLRPGGRMFISDMVLLAELPEEVASDPSKWVSCVGGAELKDTYLGRIRNAGFQSLEPLEETPVFSDEGWSACVRSLKIKALKPA